MDILQHVMQLSLLFQKKGVDIIALDEACCQTLNTFLPIYNYMMSIFH